MKRVGPVLRITIGLVVITACLLIAAHLVGLVPDERRSTFETRERSVETLAVQIAVEIDRLDADMVQRVLEAVLQRNADMRSAALRDASGQIVAAAGDHARYWHGGPGDRSTLQYMRAPIFAGKRRWGTIEAAYAPTSSNSPLLLLVLFIALTSAVGYFFVLRRTLTALDPSAVIPRRVQAAMDALFEGVLILDEKEQIVLANGSFADTVGIPANVLIGRRASDMKWRSPETGGAPAELPWRTATSSRVACGGTSLLLRTASGKVCRLMVNATPIMGAGGHVNGSLATFADVTLLERRNYELQRTLTRLKESQNEVEHHNVELRLLATRDPLTGCLNRRALFQNFEQEIARARSGSGSLTCAMVDIDYFKAINDQYGHATGDKVITLMAETLRQGVGEKGQVARYGGEEFCVVLPGTDAQQAQAMIDRLRAALTSAVALQITSGMRVTFSAGIAALQPRDKDAANLIERADGALYAAKHRGRDRVVAWYESLEQELLTERGSPQQPQIPTARSSSWSGRVRVQAAVNPEVSQLVRRISELEIQLQQQPANTERAKGAVG